MAVAVDVRDEHGIHYVGRDPGAEAGEQARVVHAWIDDDRAAGINKLSGATGRIRR